MKFPFNNKFSYKLAPDGRLDTVMPTIPINSFIDKGITGCGGSTLAIKTIDFLLLIMPNVPPIKDKLAEHDGLLGVFKDQNDPKLIAQYLSDPAMPAKKILVTPESFHKVIEAAASIGMLNTLYNDFVVVIDEQHSYVTDEYRENMLAVLDHVWSFRKKAFLSATPIMPSDPRYRELEYHKVELTQRYVNKITVMKATCVKACLHELLKANENGLAHLHILYNSVTEIGKAVSRANLTDCNIFCAHKEENMEKLGEAQKFFRPEAPSKEEGFKTINFYTCKYLQSWNLWDDGLVATVVVTDVNVPHTCLTIREQLTQYLGRLRARQADNIIHITNTKNINKTMNDYKDYESISNEYEPICKGDIETANRVITRKFPMAASMGDFVAKYATRRADGLYEFDHGKFDQYIHDTYSDQAYEAIDFIMHEWREHTIYEPQRATFTKKLKDLLKKEPSEPKRRTQAEKMRQTVQAIHTAKMEKENGDFKFDLSPEFSELSVLSAKHPYEYQAYLEFGLEQLERMGYKKSTIEEARLLKSNDSAEAKIFKLMKQNFIVGQRYTNKQIKDTLQRYYNELQYLDPDTKQLKKAKATDLKLYFEVKGCKVNEGKGKYSNGYEITDSCMAMKMLK